MNQHRCGHVSFVIVALVILALLLGTPFLWLAGLAIRGAAETRLAPLRPLGELRPGRSVVAGEAAADDAPLLSPFSKEPCVYWAYEMEHLQWNRSNDGPREVWRLDHRVCTSRRFLLSDSTGAVWVHPDRAWFNAVGANSTVAPSRFPSLTRGELATLASDQHVDDDVSLEHTAAFGELDQRWRIVEKLIPVGAPVWAEGTVSGNPGPLRTPELRGTGKLAVRMTTGGRRGLSVSGAIWPVLIALALFGVASLLAAERGRLDVAVPLAVLPPLVLAGACLQGWLRVR